MGLRLWHVHYPLRRIEPNGSPERSPTIFNKGIAMKYGISERQEEVLNFIVEYIKNNKFSPTIRNIQDGTGMKSVSQAHNIIEILKERGRITYLKGKSRSITVVDSNE